MNIGSKNIYAQIVQAWQPNSVYNIASHIILWKIHDLYRPALFYCMGLSDADMPVRDQAIIRSNAELFGDWTTGHRFKRKLNRNRLFSLNEMHV